MTTVKGGETAAACTNFTHDSGSITVLSRHQPDLGRHHHLEAHPLVKDNMNALSLSICAHSPPGKLNPVRGQHAIGLSRASHNPRLPA